jgi:hypothetical protein
LDPQASVTLAAALFGVAGALVGIGWRVAALVRQVEDRIRERYGVPVFARLDELGERLARVEHQVSNDITGRRGVHDLRDRVIRLESALDASRALRMPCDPAE